LQLQNNLSWAWDLTLNRKVIYGTFYTQANLSHIFIHVFSV
jgi:hypothetical protein